MRPGQIAVGRDTRTTGPVLANALKAGLLATGCEVIDCGILPTPALQYIVKEHYDGGAMITASHNPPEYNGVKIIEPDGTEMGDEETIRLEELLSDHSIPVRPWNQVGTEVTALHLVDEYIHAVASQFEENIGRGMTIVVDPGFRPGLPDHPGNPPGAGMPRAYHQWSYGWDVSGAFTGAFPEGLEGLAALVLASHAAFGVAHDGDADRAVFIDNKGVFVEENDEFALIVQHICKNAKGIIVTPVSTSQVVELVAVAAGCTVQYTPVGSIYVARTMRQLVETGNPVIFGGEGNGGLIFPNHQFCRDGGMTAAAMVSLLAETGKSLSSLIGQLPKRYMIKEKISTTHGAQLIEGLGKYYEGESVDHTDGLKIKRHKKWALIRASGTEPLVRIMVDAAERDAGLDLLSEIKTSVSEILDELP